MTKLWMSALMLVAVACAAPARSEDAPAGKTKVVHVVSFKFKDGTPAEKIKEIETAFRALKTQISQVTAYQGGKNVSTEGKDKGFHHTSILEFKNMADLKTYVEHPAHTAFVKMLGGAVEDVIVTDFWE